MKGKTFLSQKKELWKIHWLHIQSKLLNRLNLQGEIQYRLVFIEYFIRCFYLTDASVVNNMPYFSLILKNHGANDCTSFDMLELWTGSSIYF